MRELGLYDDGDAIAAANMRRATSQNWLRAQVACADMPRVIIVSSVESAPSIEGPTMVMATQDYASTTGCRT